MSTVRALNPRQERRLVNFLDDKFLELTRNYKKRSQPSTHLPTLTLYLEASRTLLSLILQIPPIDPSTSLRTAYLLRLTNDVLASAPGYPADGETIPILLDWLDDLDQAWLSVLQAQVWDAENGPADLVIDAEAAATGMKSSPVSQTERTRLRSLLIGGSATLEEWLAAGESTPHTIIEEDEDETASPMGDVENVLERLGVQDGFDELFFRTLQELGALGAPFQDECIPSRFRLFKTSSASSTNFHLSALTPARYCSAAHHSQYDELWKLYSNSLLANLNSRATFRARNAANDINLTIPRSTVGVHPAITQPNSLKVSENYG
ncbi:hypothetical protein C8R43DRAFT_1108830 [Mycena crocata]|nr:hypothetical protein C8R43DRAFT_1108830 [Mycena crocata]